MKVLHLKFLGGFKVSWSVRKEVAVTGKKTRALLAYLALNPDQQHSREKLATLLWGDRLDEQARHSLRQSLLALRKMLGSEKAVNILSDDESLALESGGFELDVRAFESLAAEATPETLQQAADLYGGELLEGLITDSEGFDGWLSDERVRLHDLAWQVLKRLAAHHAESNAEELAIKAGKQMVALDPLQEEGHRMLMSLYQRAGNRSAALKQYQSCVTWLRKELDAEPEPETTRLYEEIKTQKKKPESDEASAPNTYSENGAIEEPLTRPDRPSIAVLPFTNISGGTEQDYFADGICEDLITGLSKISRLSVTSQNTAFTYKGRAVNLMQVGKELGVRYVLDGSVRKSGSRVRINAQLIDAATDRHLWSERYDRELDDIFAVQDEITANIVTALDVTLLDGEQARRWRNSTQNAEAYDLFLQGRNAILTSLSQEGNSRAIRLMEQAIEVDPAFARAYAGLARQFIIQVRQGWSTDPEESLEKVHKLTNRAIELDESLAYGYSGRSHYFMMKRDFGLALADGEKAVALSPEGADVANYLGHVYIFTGEAELAVEILQRAMRLSPAIFFQNHLSLALIMLGRYEEAFTALGSHPNPSNHRKLISVAVLAGLGREQEAKAEAQKVLQAIPRFSLQEWAARQPFKNPADLEKITNLLRKAGLPE